MASLQHTTMNPYKKYKPSGIDWIGEIPNHWQLKKISHGFKKIGSGTTPTSGNQEYYNEGEFNWLQTGDLTDNEINATSKKITKKALDDFSTLRFYKPNSLVIAMYGATIGKTGILNIETTTNQACCVLSEPVFFKSKYVFYWFNANKETVISLSYGGGQPNISQEIIKSIRIPCPSLSEQTTIANYLDEKTTQIDKFITNKQKLIELLKEERAAIINEAVSGKGKNWEMKKLKYVASINSSKRNYTFEKNSDTEVVFLPMEKVSEGGIINQDTRKKINEVSTGFTYFERDDVIVAKITPCFENGKGALLDNLETDFGFGSTEFHTIKAYDKIEKEFLFFQTKTDRFMQVGEAFMTGSAGQKRVPTNFVQDFEIAVPSIEKQKEIVQHIQTETQRINNTISKIEKEIELMNEYRTALISEVVTGKIKITT